VTGSRDLLDQARIGLAAWQRGGVSVLAELLDPDVALLWWTPGDWDCDGKADVVALLTERSSAEAPSEVEITRTDKSTLLVERRDTVPDGPEAGFRPATVVRFREGRVVQMRQYRSREDALAEVR
jgi:ketosteroid isomerase-like protein